jgi:hypothetical protein
LSSIAPSTRLGWRLLPAVVAAAVAVIGASLLIAALRDHPIVDRDGPAPEAATGADVAEAAVWRTDAYPVGASGKLSKKESARFKNQKVRVRATIRDLADAIVVHPGRLPRAARRLMSNASAASLLKQVPGIPKGAEGVTAIKRTGRVGLQAPRFAAAAAEIRIVMQATIEERLVKWRDDYRFWLQRSDGRWRVIAFDIDRAQT